MVSDNIFMTTTGSHVIFLVCHYVFPGECPSSSLFVLAESEWGPTGACAWGPFTVPVPPLATVPGGGLQNTSSTNATNIHTHTPPLSHVQTEPFNLLNIYLFIEDIFSLWVQPFCPPSLCPTLLYALSRPIYCLVHGFLKQNVNMWHDHHGWPPIALCECDFFIYFGDYVVFNLHQAHFPPSRTAAAGEWISSVRYKSLCQYK